MCTAISPAGQQKAAFMTNVPNLERRRIQAEMIKPIYDELVPMIGKREARDLLARAVRRSVLAEARKAADAQPGPGRSMESFSRNFEKTYADQGPAAGLDVEVKRSDAAHLDFDVTRCRFVEMYDELGLGEVADVLSCNRDGQFATAFDPNITLERAQTIAQGAPTCTFRYTYAKGGED